MHFRPTCARVSSPVMTDDGTLTWAEMLARVAEETGDRTVAKWLCQVASGCDGDEFTGVLAERVQQRSGVHLQTMLGRLAAGEPLQYVLGRWGFRRLDVMVDPRVLIPRPETEQLVDVVLGWLSSSAPSPARVVDLGTGSGAIGLSLLAESGPGTVEVWMTDASDGALDVARANCAGIGRAGAGARFAVGDWWDALPGSLRGTLDAVVSNPPYIADDDPEVDDAVRRHEPASALFAGGDGLDALRTVVAGAPAWLAPGGLLAVEIGHRQGDAVRELFVAAGFGGVEVRDDAAGRPRVVFGTR